MDDENINQQAETSDDRYETINVCDDGSITSDDLTHGVDVGVDVGIDIGVATELVCEVTDTPPISKNKSSDNMNQVIDFLEKDRFNYDDWIHVVAVSSPPPPPVPQFESDMI